ncbi:MAG: phosphoribosyltransferase [Archaeoglobaceae archaeon]|nr:phosphoribosyltransferase [Archaeoglobaceae archaeon]MDW7989515.1 phosphoribosyltransferase [Archaeoglobaceae archaeon]
MKFMVLNWDYAEKLCRKVAMQVLEDKFKPEKIVALPKGGWFASMLMSDYLGVDVVSLNLKDDVKFSFRKALVVDDFINTGKTIKKAIERIEGEFKTSALLMFQNSNFVPDYLGEYVFGDIWVIFPWNFVEDVSALILNILEKGEMDTWEIKNFLSTTGIDPISVEIAQPGKIEEVLSVLEKRKMIEKYEDYGRTFWRLRK